MHRGRVSRGDSGPVERPGRPKAEVNVTDEDVENRLNEMADRNSRLVSVEREIQKGDTADIDFEGFDNGVPFDGGKGENFDLEIGSGSFVPCFEDQLVGMKAGEEKDIDITFPENYTPELAGKPVVFHVKVNEVKHKEVPRHRRRVRQGRVRIRHPGGAEGRYPQAADERPRGRRPACL